MILKERRNETITNFNLAQESIHRWNKKNPVGQTWENVFLARKGGQIKEIVC